MLGEITDKDFKIISEKVYIDTKINSGKPGMLLIHADWCGHCKRFQPTFDDLHQKLNSDFPLLSIEDKYLQKNQNLSSALNFRGYPSLKFFDQNGKIIGDYSGDRTKDSLLQHICKVFHHCMEYH